MSASTPKAVVRFLTFDVAFRRVSAGGEARPDRLEWAQEETLRAKVADKDPCLCGACLNICEALLHDRPQPFNNLRRMKI